MLSLAHFVFLKNFVPTFKNWKLSHKNPDFPHLLEKSPHSHIIISWRDFPGGPVVKTELPVQEAQVQSLVRELDPTCHKKKNSLKQKSTEDEL